MTAWTHSTGLECRPINGSSNTHGVMIMHTKCSRKAGNENSPTGSKSIKTNKMKLIFWNEFEYRTGFTVNTLT
jgi:hypothetical protein